MLGRALAILLVCMYIYAIWKKNFNNGSSNKKNNQPGIKKQNEDFCRCSSPLPKSRVVNGTTVIGYEFEWVVAIYSKKTNEVECTGILISEKTVLTAAHCVHNKSLTKLHILAGFSGDYRQSIDTTWGDIKIRSVRIHHKYIKNINTKPNPYDVAILYLRSPFKLGFNSSIYLACVLNHELSQPDSLDYYSAGYGLTNKYYNYLDKSKNIVGHSNKSYSKNLNSLKLSYNKETCVNKNLEKSFLCLKSKTGSLCNSDDGAGVYIFIGTKMVLVGLYLETQSIYVNDTTNEECSESSLSYNLKLSAYFDLINWGHPRCALTNKFF